MKLSTSSCFISFINLLGLINLNTINTAKGKEDRKFLFRLSIQIFELTKLSLRDTEDPPLLVRSWRRWKQLASADCCWTEGDKTQLGWKLSSHNLWTRRSLGSRCTKQSLSRKLRRPERWKEMSRIMAANPVGRIVQKSISLGGEGR